MGFVHLHLHTPFSFLDGASSIEQLVERAAAFGLPALAVTDHNNLCAAVRFQKAVQKAGLKPIFGAELTLKGGNHLTLLTSTREGYSNLCRILTHSHLSSDRKDPQADQQVLRENSRGLFGLSGCWRGEIPRLLLSRNREEAKRAALKYLDIFGKENFYLELQSTLLPWERELNHSLVELGRSLGIKGIATNNVHYATQEEFRVQDVLTCIRTLTRLDEPHGERKINRELWLKPPSQMEELFQDLPEAISNTQEIAERCQSFTLQDPSLLPRFELPEGETAVGLLRKLVKRGARGRYGRLTPKVRRRLEYELSVIEQLGFADYFLVVWELVRYAQRKGIRHAGRGSAADSAVAYCLGITEVDSIARDLRFERFINPERRNNLPDIDVDFDARYRDEVTEWVTQRYGEERVGTVCTFSRYRARGALRDVGKALDFPPQEIDRLAKLMPWVEADEIGDALSRFPELRQSRIPKRRFHQLFELCAALADHPRHIGSHLGGVVITGEPIWHISPLERSAKGGKIIELDKDDVEDLGLLKLDLLCLRMLSAVEDTLKLVNSEGEGQLDFDKIPLDDSPTYDLLNSGETAGAFQLESPAQRSLQRRLKSRDIEDVVASVALIRPGPVQGNMVEPFINRRGGREPVDYLHPKLESILEKTYGVVLFQEQVVEIAVEIAGFSPGEADLLRRTMTHHRSREEMRAIGEHFIQKALARGVSKKVAETIFSYVQGYAGYGFCEAHAAAFGHTAYKTAYLLRHYPVHFYAALLSNQPMGFYPSHTLINEAKRKGIKVLPPNVNRSESDFRVENGGIRVGLKSVKELSERALESILANRPYLSFEDFLRRVSIPKNQMENLILCGAFDSSEPHRKRLMWELQVHSEESWWGSTHDFSEVEDYTDWEKFCFEWKILEFSPRHHPLEYFREELRRLGFLTSSQVKGLKGSQQVKVGGLVVRPHRPPTRSGRVVVFLSLEDETGLIDATIFEPIYERYGRIIFSKPILLIEGTTDERGTTSVIARKVSELPKSRPKRLARKLSQPQITQTEE